jgi:TolB-like protein/Tfp pilus assembly protein PilF
VAAGLLAAIAAAACGLVFVFAPTRLCTITGFGCPAPAAANSIAVLPLANLSADPSQEYFADGLTEELIGSLAKLGQFQVVGRTSSFKFKDSHETSAAIGQTLHVTYLIDGSVRRAGDMVRVSATLVDASTGFERWSETFDRRLDDAFAVQSGIAQAVADALRVKLMGGDVAALSTGGTANGAAYDSYLRGRELIRSAPNEAGDREALARFDDAIARDPKFTAAYAWRAIILTSLADEYTLLDDVRRTYEQAEASARKAVALDPGLPIGQAALGVVLYRGRFDFADAQAAFTQAMKSGAGDVTILSMFAQFNDALGDLQSGLAAHRRAALLDPLDALTHRQLGRGLFRARLYGEAAETMRQVLALNPGANDAHAVIGDVLYLTGDLAGARREYALEPLDFLRAAGDAMVLQRQGDLTGAQSALRRLSADRATPYQQAQVFAQWGEPDRAFAAIDRAFVIGDSGLLDLRTDPLLDPVRDDPRFAARLERLTGSV